MAVPVSASSRAYATSDSRRSPHGSRSCRACPRLVAWREQVARERRAASPTRSTGADPVAGFGDGAARIALLGLAPAAHGANRTGRVFTGDRSGRLPLRGALARRPREPADLGGARRRPRAPAAASSRRPCAARRPRTARRRRARSLPAVMRARELELLERAARDRLPRRVSPGTPRWALRRARAPRRGSPTAPSSAPTRPDAARLLSPEPAEHVHRPADRADDRRRFSRARASWPASGAVTSSDAAERTFTQQVRDWFENAFEAPTPAQAQAWPAIATGEHVLISAPTGSGKTLAAFLWALDGFVREPAVRRAPHTPRLRLAAEGAVLRHRAQPAHAAARSRPRPRVAIRTGDTPARERAAMLRAAPDILITTPESLYLMLTSRARELLASARRR
jgi:hypothetical protein